MKKSSSKDTVFAVVIAIAIFLLFSANMPKEMFQSRIFLGVGTGIVIVLTAAFAAIRKNKNYFKPAM